MSTLKHHTKDWFTAISREETQSPVLAAFLYNVNIKVEKHLESSMKLSNARRAGLNYSRVQGLSIVLYNSCSVIWPWQINSVYCVWNDCGPFNGDFIVWRRAWPHRSSNKWVEMSEVLVKHIGNRKLYYKIKCQNVPCQFWA